jgi:exodeoxyribonuclease V
VTKPDPREKFTSTVRAQLSFELNTDQEEALDRLTTFILSPLQQPLFVLNGYAGTGKTSVVSAVTKALPSLKWRSVLLAPTGRAAKVLSGYAQRQASTIHRKIYKRVTDGEGSIRFSTAENLHRKTLFIVDEASMIGGADKDGSFTNLLGDLLEYVFSGDDCRLLLLGDTAQLPPVGSELSPALDLAYLRASYHLDLGHAELREVARQRLDSAILLNATQLRVAMASPEFAFPRLQTAADFQRINGTELEDILNDSLSRYGDDGVIILTRSNKQAGLYNRSYRTRIRGLEEDLCTGDRLMVVKNNYFWLSEGEEAGFIANGDIAEISRIVGREEAYGFAFCDCFLRFTDYPNMADQQVKIVTSCLYSDAPALKPEEQRALYEAVMEDVVHEPSRGLRMAYLRKSPYYHALQVKFAYAVTCHKAQGGQWPVVFIDQGFLQPQEPDRAYTRWLYTAVTRASEKVYLVNFGDRFFE